MFLFDSGHQHVRNLAAQREFVRLLTETPICRHLHHLVGKDILDARKVEPPRCPYLLIVEKAWLVVSGVCEDSQEFVAVRGSGSTIVLSVTGDSTSKGVVSEKPEDEEVRKCGKDEGHGSPLWYTGRYRTGTTFILIGIL